MKLKKINQEILKIIDSESRKLFIEQNEENVYITDSYIIWILKEENFIYNSNKIKNANILKIIEEIENSNLTEGFIESVLVEDRKQYATLTNFEKTIKVKFMGEYLKYFDSDCKFKIVNDITPVLVYEQDTLVGVICPVKEY